MSLTHALVAADERSDRHALRRGERGVPSRAMLHRSHGLAAGISRLAGGLMANELLASDRMLALGEALELFFADFAHEAPAVRELSAPDAANLIAFRVVVLARVLEFLRVVAPRLARTQRLGDCEHRSAIGRTAPGQRLTGTAAPGR